MFKQTVRSLNTTEKKEMLKDLQAEYMTTRAIAKREQLSNRYRNPKLLRRMIAIIKTELNYKGYGY